MNKKIARNIFAPKTGCFDIFRQLFGAVFCQRVTTNFPKKNLAPKVTQAENLAQILAIWASNPKVLPHKYLKITLFH